MKRDPCHRRLARGRVIRPVARLALLGLLLWPAPAPAAEEDAAAALFVDKCATCHSVGTNAELDGPDLAPVVKWSPGDLQAAIQRMSDNVGELSAAEVSALTAFLQSGQGGARLNAHRAAAAAVTPEVGEPASSPRGELLYWGQARLTREGMACFACHALDGAGGTLGPDLSDVGTKLGNTALIAAISNARYKVMRAPYAEHPVSSAEAADLAAYLASSKRTSHALVLDPRWVAAVVVGLFMLATALVATRRGRLTRAALLRRKDTKG